MVPGTTKHYGLFPHVHAFIPRDCAAFFPKNWPFRPSLQRLDEKIIGRSASDDFFAGSQVKPALDDANQNRWDLWMFNCLYPPHKMYI